MHFESIIYNIYEKTAIAKELTSHVRELDALEQGFLTNIVAK
jgi:hypothetical protein